MTNEFANIGLSLITPSLTNPRKNFNAAKLAELAESIKASGVHQPILVRFLPGSRTPDTDRGVIYELVAGERRYRASQQAGVDTIPAMIRALTDDQVMEIQIVENLQRDDLTELEEAEGYEQLMQHSSLNADQVGAKIGKSRSYVYARLKLLDLCPEARTSLREGKVDASRALLVARIPDHKLQIKAMKEIVSGQGYYGGERDPMTHREALAHVQQNYMLKLGDARFKITDATLMPSAGRCKDCSKRTGANPDLFSDVKSADVCTDPPCFHKKEEAATKLLVKEAQAKGQTVIVGDEARELVTNHYTGAFKGYKRLDDKEDSPTDEPLRKIIGKLMGERGIKPTMLESPRKKGQLEACLPNDVANTLLKEVQAQAKANKAPASKEVQALLDEKASQEKAKLDAKYLREVRAQIIAETWDEIQRSDGSFIAQGSFTIDIHRHLASQTAWSLDADSAEAASKLLNTGSVGAQHGLRELVKKHPRPDQLHLLLIMHTRGEGFDLVTKAAHGGGLNTFTKRIEVEVKARVYPKPAKKAPAADAPAARPQGGAGGAKPKTPPARAAKTSPEEAKRGIADALQGLEGSASAPKGAVAPPAKPAPWDLAKPTIKPTTTAAAKAPADPMLAKAVEVITKAQKASVRLLKDELGIGTTTALKLMASLEAAGKVSAAEERGARKVLVAA